MIRHENATQPMTGTGATRDRDPASKTLEAVRDTFGPATWERYRLLLLHQVHDRHDGGRLSQLDAEFFEDRPEKRQELVECFLALPDVEHLRRGRPVGSLTEQRANSRRSLRGRREC